MYCCIHLFVKASHANVLIYSPRLKKADIDFWCSPQQRGQSCKFAGSVCFVFVQKPSGELFLLIWSETSMMQWTSRLQTDTIRCEAAVSHQPQDTFASLHQSCDTKHICCFVSVSREDEDVFLPDEVSLQANDPLDDLLLGVLGRPEGTIKHEQDDERKIPNRKKLPNKNHRGVKLREQLCSGRLCIQIWFQIWRTRWSSIVWECFQTVALIKASDWRWIKHRLHVGQIKAVFHWILMMSLFLTNWQTRCFTFLTTAGGALHFTANQLLCTDIYRSSYTQGHVTKSKFINSFMPHKLQNNKMVVILWSASHRGFNIWDTAAVSQLRSASFRGASEGQLHHNAERSLSQSEGSSRGSFFSMFLEDMILHGLTYPKILCAPKKEERKRVNGDIAWRRSSPSWAWVAEIMT